MKAILSILFLIISNFFMTFAWYGHLQVKKWNILQSAGLFSIILISWGIAFFEYIFQVPGNRIGSNQFGGPFNLFQLKIIQEVFVSTLQGVFHPRIVYPTIAEHALSASSSANPPTPAISSGEVR